MLRLFVACPAGYIEDCLSKDLTFQQDDGNVTFIASRPIAVAMFLDHCADQILGPIDDLLLDDLSQTQQQRRSAKSKRRKPATEAASHPAPVTRTHAIAGAEFINADEILSGVYTVLELQMDAIGFTKELCRGKAPRR